MKLIAATLAAVLGLAACASAGPRSTLGPTSPSPSLPTDIASPKPAPTSAEATSAPTNSPQSTLTGEFPGPDVTVPPGQPVISNLRLDDIATVWATLGLSCVSSVSGGPERAAAYDVHCEGGNPGANVDVVAEAAYWTPDGVATMDVVVNPISDGSIDASTAANDWVLPFAELAGGDAAVAWVIDHIGDTACRSGCTMVVRGSDLSYYSGSRGGHELFLVAPVPVR